MQEAQKNPALKRDFADLELHLIGPLQTNKVKEAAALFDVIETLDRTGWPMRWRPSMTIRLCPRLFLQVNTGEEPQKAGVLPLRRGILIGYVRKLDLPLEGLMCIPPADDDAAPHFAFLAKLARDHGLKNLSMGMSGDFEMAVEVLSAYACARRHRDLRGARNYRITIVSPGASCSSASTGIFAFSATVMRRGKIRLGIVQENGAALARHDRIVVEADHRHHVIKMILAPHGFGAGGIGQLHQPVVIGIVRRIAPAVIPGDLPQRQRDLEILHPVGAIKDFADGKAAARGNPVAFAGLDSDAARPDGRAPFARAPVQPECRPRPSSQSSSWPSVRFEIRMIAISNSERTSKPRH